MEIRLIKYYTDKLELKIDPSDRDINFDFFTHKLFLKIQLPFKTYRGKRLLIDCNCMACEKTFQIEDIFLPFEGKHKHSYIDIERLTTLYHSLKFIQTISEVFRRVKGNDYGHFFGYRLEGEGRASIFYQKCPHCNAQYLVTYCDKQGVWPERGSSATPDEIYIEEIAWVEFNDEEFFQEMKIKDNPR